MLIIDTFFGSGFDFYKICMQAKWDFITKIVYSGHYHTCYINKSVGPNVKTIDLRNMQPVKNTQFL